MKFIYYLTIKWYRIISRGRGQQKSVLLDKSVEWVSFSWYLKLLQWIVVLCLSIGICKQVKYYTANNESIDPNSLRCHINFCLLVEWDKHWVSRWYCTSVLITMAQQDIPRAVKEHMLVMQYTRIKLSTKNTENIGWWIAVHGKCLTDSAQVKSCDQTAGRGVYNLLFCIVCPAPKLNRNQCGAWVSLGLSIRC